MSVRCSRPSGACRLLPVPTALPSSACRPCGSYRTPEPALEQYDCRNPFHRAKAKRSVATSAASVSAGVVAEAGTNAHLSAVVLGWLVIAGSWFRSVPQILRIIRAKSADGLSVTANLVEMVCYTVIVGYNVNHAYPVSSYGDVFACWIQDIIVMGLIIYHLKPKARVLIPSALAFVAASYWIISGQCGMQVLIWLQVFVTFAMGLGARVPQIWLNFKRGNSGELSPITCGLSTAGNLVRIYTTVVLTADLILVASTATQFVFNAILLYQCMQTEFKNRKLKKQAEAAADGKAA